MNRIMVQCFTGALAGLAATVPMTLAMFAVQRIIPWSRRFKLPPKQITEEAIRQMGLPQPPEPLSTALTAVNHLGYGALIGAFYRTALNWRAHSTVTGGIAYGLGIWTVSYLGWLPATGLYPSATQELPERNGLMLTAHVVWGASFSLILQAMNRCETNFKESRDEQQRRWFTIMHRSNGQDAQTLETGLTESQATEWLERKAKATGSSMSEDLIVTTSQGAESWQAVRAE